MNGDLSAFQRKFVAEVKRCDEMERKLRYMEGEVKKEKVLILDAVEIPKAPNPREIIDLEASCLIDIKHKNIFNLLRVPKYS